MTDFYWKQGDTAPALAVTLRDGNGVAVDLTGATVRFHLVDAVARALMLNVAATVTSAATGQVRVNPATAQIPRPGNYLGEFEVTFADGTIETWPNDTDLQITVKAALA
jgi:hypothetical protein